MEKVLATLHYAGRLSLDRKVIPVPLGCARPVGSFNTIKHDVLPSHVAELGLEKSALQWGLDPF